jgi:arginase family enzyme
LEGSLTIDATRQLVALLCRTSDRYEAGMAGAAVLAERLGARVIGSPGEPREAGHAEDLASSRGCLLEAGGQIDDALDAGKVPILLAGDCAISVATLPIVMRHHPDAFILWLDAHPDFNTPESSTTDYLGGMGLAGACDMWDSGFGGGVDPARVVMFGVREIDGPEQVLLETKGVGVIDRPGALADLLDGRKVYVHLDCDVIDPDVVPSSYPTPGGLDLDQLHRLLDLDAGAADVIGAEITAANPDFGEELAEVLAPLL